MTARKQIKVVYNAQYGGFSLSDEAAQRLRELGVDYRMRNELARHDARLVQVVEELGHKASGRFASLKIATVCGKYRIDEYDGCETVQTPADIEWVKP